MQLEKKLFSTKELEVLFNQHLAQAQMQASTRVSYWSACWQMITFGIAQKEMDGL